MNVESEDDLPTAVLAALADDDSRSILSATASKRRSTAELVERCDIPIATTYRKVKALSKLGLLTDGIRIKPKGRNVTEYGLRAETVIVTLEESDITVTCSIDEKMKPERADEKPSADEASKQVWVATDGGEEQFSGASDSRQYQLRALFVDVTGVEEVVIEQERPVSRNVDDTASVSEYVTALAKEDGLSESIDGGDVEEMD